ncbi:MAG TPA: acetyltransferase [Chthoniobacterales bacterium]|nr:acetyltransferase [Chthoniobacterales bacterium]
MRKKPLILVGDSVFAQIAFEFFQHDSEYEVVAFAVERAYLTKDTLFNRPVVAFEDMEKLYRPQEHAVFVALVFSQFNRLRERLYLEAKVKGYEIASYVSSAALLRPGVAVGEHCFICEHVVIQPFTRIGNNVVIWSGNQICHKCRIGDNAFVLPNCIVSDGVTIGRNSIVGANVTVLSDRTIGHDVYIGPAVTIDADVADRAVIERIETGSAPPIPAEVPA